MSKDEIIASVKAAPMTDMEYLLRLLRREIHRVYDLLGHSEKVREGLVNQLARITAERIGRKKGDKK